MQHYVQDMKSSYLNQFYPVDGGRFCQNAGIQCHIQEDSSGL